MKRQAIGSGGVVLGFAMMLVAFNLRPALSTVGPLLGFIRDTTGLTATGAAALTTLPVLCLGLACALARACHPPDGPDLGVLAGMGLVAVGLALRGLGDIPTLFLGTAVAATGIGFANVLLPALVKRDFSRQSGVMTGLYTMTLCLGAAAGAGAAVPVERAVDGWPIALAVWALPAVIAAWRGCRSPAQRPLAAPAGRTSAARSPRVAGDRLHGPAILPRLHPVRLAALTAPGARPRSAPCRPVRLARHPESGAGRPDHGDPCGPRPRSARLDRRHSGADRRLVRRPRLRARSAADPRRLRPRFRRRGLLRACTDAHRAPRRRRGERGRALGDGAGDRLRLRRPRALAFGLAHEATEGWGLAGMLFVAITLSAIVAGLPAGRNRTIAAVEPATV